VTRYRDDEQAQHSFRDYFLCLTNTVFGQLTLLSVFPTTFSISQRLSARFHSALLSYQTSFSSSEFLGSLEPLHMTTTTTTRQSNKCLHDSLSPHISLLTAIDSAIHFRAHRFARYQFSFHTTGRPTLKEEQAFGR